ncbi:MAG: peptide/nickel transport system ATP-binding protein [Pseudonocardiales bacterium]|nr:peptide/nickel transport system ATP-binding protein [Pseudonocardiales bacterium]
MSLLEVRNLTVGVPKAPAPILRDVALRVEPGEIVGLVGESGSGKSMASYAIMGILPRGVRMHGGTVTVDGVDLTQSRRRSVDGRVAMIFQNPKAALNPLMRVGDQVARMVHIHRRLSHQGLSRKAAGAEAIALLRRVGIPGADRVARAYPHQLSGGMCQRIMISMALACRPRVLIADEPTTALDVTVQAQIFDLIRELVAETGCGVLFITHDLAAVAEMCDRTMVLYGGQVMEEAPTATLFAEPTHPYTRYLFEAADRDVDLTADHGAVDLTSPGCRFAPHCALVSPACTAVPPALPVAPGHTVACFHPDGERHAVA